MQFTLCNPTEIRFGKGQIASVGELVPTDAKILLLYGGGSIKSNGVYDQVMKALADRHIDEFGGVEVNPHYDTPQEASKLARKNGTTFVLGVGGGSVIDASKFLASMIAAGTDDPWDQLVANPDSVTPLPNGAILTRQDISPTEVRAILKLAA